MKIEETELEKLLLRLEDTETFGKRYRFYKEERKPVLLGAGASSRVYEMYDRQNMEHHYAAKIIMPESEADRNRAAESVQLQRFLGEQSENILKVLGFFEMRAFPEVQETTEGFPLQMILMEQLEPTVQRDRAEKEIGNFRPGSAEAPVPECKRKL